jgi:hypothetical protein
MADNQAKIEELEAEIKAIKDSNKNWASGAGDKAAIAAARQQIVGLQNALLAPGKLPTLHSYVLLIN